MNDSDSKPIEIQSGCFGLVSSLFGGLDELATTVGQLETFTRKCGDAKGTFDHKKMRKITSVSSLDQDDRLRLAEWLRLRRVSGVALLPRAKALTSSMLAAAFAIDDIGRQSSQRVPAITKAVRSAALAAVQRLFEERGIDRVLDAAQRWLDDDLGLTTLAGECYNSVLANIGKPDPASSLTSNMMPICTMLPLEFQVISLIGDHNLQWRALTEHCLSMVDHMIAFEDDLDALIRLPVWHERRAITFTRKSERRDHKKYGAEDYPELHYRAVRWIAWSNTERPKLKAAIETAMESIDKDTLPMDASVGHNLMGAQVMFNHLGTLTGVGLLQTVSPDSQLEHYASTASKKFAAWRAARTTKTPKPQSSTVRLATPKGDQEVEPRHIESVVLTTEDLWVFVIGDDRPDWLNFPILTPIDVFRKAFLKSAVFIDAEVQGEFVSQGGRKGNYLRALINITQIKQIQMFDEGDAWIIFKQGGEINGVKLDERSLDNLVRRAGMVMTERVPLTPDDLGGYRIFERSEEEQSSESRDADLDVEYEEVPVAAPQRSTPVAKPEQCPLCSRTSPCASRNCGLKR